MFHILLIVALLGLPIVPVFAADATPTLDPHINALAARLAAADETAQTNSLRQAAEHLCESLAGIGAVSAAQSRACWPAACWQQSSGISAEALCQFPTGIGQVRVGYSDGTLTTTISIPIN
jgi:hypothetical protein